MNRIEIQVLNPESVKEAEVMMVCAARLTQRGHQIKDVHDFYTLLDAPYKDTTVRAMAKLPHPTIQKFGCINVVVVGASRRFLAQITRHQNEVKFMSASLQYSDYSDGADFVVPYELIGSGQEDGYKAQCRASMLKYQSMITAGIDNDAAGYIMPQSLRGVLIISATPYQWKHMIHQRVCRRNTAETRYVMLKIWEQLEALSPALFGGCGPFCQEGACAEGKMGCGWRPATGYHAKDFLAEDFPELQI